MRVVLLLAMAICAWSPAAEDDPLLSEEVRAAAAAVEPGEAIPPAVRAALERFAEEAEIYVGDVEMGLTYLQRVQDEDGSWLHGDDEPASEREDDPMRLRLQTTAVCVLAFLGAGYDHKTPNRYQRAVRDGLRFLVDRQDGATGRIDDDPVVQGWALMALAEAYAMTNDPKLRAPAQSACAALVGMGVHRREEEAGEVLLCGWNRGGDDDRIDIVDSLPGIMALKAAKVAGLDVGSSLDGLRRWFDRTWARAYGEDRAFDGDPVLPFPRAAAPDGAALGRDGGQGEALCAGVFLGIDADSPRLRGLANAALMEATAGCTEEGVDAVHVHPAMLGLFQMGRDHWRLGKVLCLAPLDRHWLESGAFAPSPGFVRRRGSHRVLATGHTLLTKEVLHRYLPVAVGGVGP